MWFLAGLGALIAGIILVAGPLPGVLKAMTTGVLIGKGHGSPRVERSAEPERFKTLLRGRMASMGPGFVIILVSLGWLAWNLLSIWVMRPPQG